MQKWAQMPPLPLWNRSLTLTLFPLRCGSISLALESGFGHDTAATAKSLQSCPTLCDPIPGILRARTLEWAAISFSNA